MNNGVKAILKYWFGEIVEGFPTEEKFKLWFKGGKEVDENIKENFNNYVIQAEKRELTSWEQSSQSRMALIILLDQFTRNIYRGSSQAFASDDYVLKLCKEGLKLKHDEELSFIERSFFYLPLVHSEKLDNHDLCIKLNQALVDTLPEKHLKLGKGFLNSAIEHRAIIQKYGRYPHRNIIMSRSSTREELEYLSGNHNSFGQ